jgi:adenine deaminase
MDMTTPMEWQPEIDAATRARAVQAAQGNCAFDLLLAGGQLVDVITGEIRAADVGIVGPIIASVHTPGTRADAASIHSLDGRYIAPGFIDTHVHLESSHMLPHHYAATVVPQGTTTVFWDPHELANVLGVKGVRYAADASRNLPLRCLIQAPSSVPSAPAIEASGASFDRAEMREMMSWPEVIGVAEMMDMNGVLRGSSRMVAVAEEGRAAGKLVEGHARGLTGPRLQGYLAAGIGSDHEITSGDDLLEKLRAGLAIEIRGSHNYVLPPVVEALNKLPHLSSQIMFCTDDVPPDHLVTAGGVNDVLRRFIAVGMKPVDAIRFATFNAALHLGRRDLGAVCAGRIADIVIISDLKRMTVTDVFVSGRHAAQNGKLLQPVVAPAVEAPGRTVYIAPRRVEDFRLAVKGVANGRVRLKTIKGVRFSEWSEVEVEVRNGFVELPSLDDLNFIYVQHRHGRHDALPQIALQEGLPRLKGALATTYLHDSHNLFVIGGNPDDMQLAANTLISCGGGIAAVQNGRLLSVAEFPIAGMLSQKSPGEVAEAFEAVRQAAGQVAEWKPPYWIFKTLEGMSLACNPFPYLTDLGLADGLLGEFVEMEVTHRTGDFDNRQKIPLF